MANISDNKNGVSANGVRWKTIRRDHTNTATLVIFIKGGLFRESTDDNGIGAMFARNWLKCGSLLELVEYLGGGLDAGLSSDYLEISLSVPTDTLSEVLPALRKQLSAPEFAQGVFDKEKDLALREIEAEKDDPNGVAFQLFMEATYGGHPYAMKPEGRADTVSGIQLADVKEYYANQICAADTAAVLAGRFDEKHTAELQALLEMIPAGSPVNISHDNADISSSEIIESFDPRIQQAKLFLAYTAPTAADKDYVYSKILCDLLGGGMSSPYFTALRKEKGYAYSVGTMNPSRLCASRMVGYIGLQEENIDDAIETMKHINSNIGNSVSSDDLEKTKNHMLGKQLLEMETNSRTAWYAAFFENLGLGFDHTATYVEQIRNAAVEDIKRTAELFRGPYTVFAMKPER